MSLCSVFVQSFAFSRGSCYKMSKPNPFQFSLFSTWGMIAYETLPPLLFTTRYQRQCQPLPQKPCTFISHLFSSLWLNNLSNGRFGFCIVVWVRGVWRKEQLKNGRAREWGCLLILPSRGSRDRRGSGGRLLPQGPPLRHLLPPACGPTASPNSTTIWRQSVQLHKPVGLVSHSNHNSVWTLNLQIHHLNELSPR